MNSTIKLLAAVLAVAIGVFLFLRMNSEPLDVDSDVERNEVVARAPDAPEGVAGVAGERTEAKAVEASARAESLAPAPDVPMEEPTLEPAPPEPGCVRIVGTAGGAPLAGATATLVQTGEDWLSPDQLTGDGARRYVLDDTGTAEACALEAGSYIVALEDSARATRQSRVRVTGDAGQVVTIQLGAAAIRGTVTRWNGEPVAGACVTAYGKTGASGMTLAWTDAAGRYAVEQLDAGKYSVAAYFEGSTYDDADDARAISLGETEVATVDLGAQANWFTCTGTLVTEGGEPIPAVGDAAAEVRFSVPGGTSRGVRVDANGSYMARLAPGSYVVSLRPIGHSHSVELTEPLVIESSDIERDVTLSGARLTGTVFDAPGGNPIQDPATLHRMTVRAHLEGRTDSASFHKVPVGADGRYSIDGLAPGDWRVGISKDGLDAELPVQIAEGTDVVTIDLVRKPR